MEGDGAELGEFRLYAYCVILNKLGQAADMALSG